MTKPQYNVRVTLKRNNITMRDEQKTGNDLATLIKLVTDHVVDFDVKKADDAEDNDMTYHGGELSTIYPDSGKTEQIGKICIDGSLVLNKEPVSCLCCGASPKPGPVYDATTGACTTCDTKAFVVVTG